MFPKAGDAVKRGQVIGLSEYRIIKGSLAFWIPDSKTEKLSIPCYLVMTKITDTKSQI
jgi:hypothetical protein